MAQLPTGPIAPRRTIQGGDSFTFKANDGKAFSNTATVSISVASVNEKPVVSWAERGGEREWVSVHYTDGE